MFIYKHMRKQGTLAETYTMSAIYIAQVMNIKKNIVHPTALIYNHRRTRVIIQNKCFKMHNMIRLVEK